MHTEYRTVPFKAALIWLLRNTVSRGHTAYFAPQQYVLWHRWGLSSVWGSAWLLNSWCDQEDWAVLAQKHSMGNRAGRLWWMKESLPLYWQCVTAGRRIQILQPWSSIIDWLGWDLKDHLAPTSMPWVGAPSPKSAWSKPHPTWPTAFGNFLVLAHNAAE